MQIAQHTVVTIEHTLRNEQGVVVETSVGKAPLVYLHGAGNFLPGLEAALAGKQAGDKVSVVLAPESAHGVRDERLVRKLATRKLSSERVVAGKRYQVELDGRARLVTVRAVQGDYATVDGNHPLAGMNLSFEVEIKDVRPATAEELAHGHVHGAGGHAH
jgi:FKBP-type peptidyl-prolyl cis-trans isomerase SlyD